MADSYHFYISTDDMFSMIVYRDGSVYDLSAVTKVAICFDGTTYSSADHPNSFDWTSGDTGEIKFYLGKISDIDEAVRDAKAEVILYDPSSTNGFVIGTIDVDAREIE